MSIVTLKTIPGFADLSDSVLAYNQPARGIHVEEISANAAFAYARCEIFSGMYFDGDTVGLPISGIDGYEYSREELIYVYNIAVSTNKDSGWISSGVGSFWFCNWFVDQATGEVTSLEWYRNSGSGGSRSQTNDGQIIVYTIGQRQRQNIIMASTPTYSSVSSGDIGVDKPWKQSLAQGLNNNAKFAVTNSEIFFCGEFQNGQTVSAGLLVSPADGYTYSYGETKFLAFWRWTTQGSQFVSPPETYSQLGRFSCDIDSSGNVTTAVYATDNDGNDQHCINYGRVAVVAFCQRSATPGSATLADDFVEIDEQLFMPGNTLRASTVAQMKKNIDEAVLTPEFFGPTTYADGDTVPLPVSPVDGYTYTRDEITVLWAWSVLDPGSTPHDRIPVFYGSVDATTGAVALACWRLTDHYIDDNNTYCRISTVVMARRQQAPPGPVDGNAGTDPNGGGTVGNGGGGLPTDGLTGDILRFNIYNDRNWALVNYAQPFILIHSNNQTGPLQVNGVYGALALTVTANNGSSTIDPTATSGSGTKYFSTAVGSTSTVIGAHYVANGNQSLFGITAWYRWTFRCSIGNTSNARYWFGFACYSNLGTGNNGAAIVPSTAYAADSPNKSTIGFRYSAGTDTNWQAVTCTAGGSQTTVDTGVAADTSIHVFEMATDYASATIYYFIDQVLVATITTNIPPAGHGGQSCGELFFTGDNKNTATAITLTFYSMWCSLKW